MKRSYGLTNRGLVRDNNQDTFFASDDEGIWLVADGMGGRHGGEVASEIARSTIVTAIKQGQGSKASIKNANRDILKYGCEHQDYKGMGTTVVVVMEKDFNIEINWVGDSRAYLWRKNKLFQLSTDHSVVQRLLDGGMITKKEAINHPKRNLVTSVLGMAIERDSDLEIGHLDLQWRNGDKLLLCTDGLSDELLDEDIQSIMLTNSDSKQQVEALLQAALIAGGRDNTTVLIIESPKIKSARSRFMAWIKPFSR